MRCDVCPADDAALDHAQAALGKSPGQLRLVQADEPGEVLRQGTGDRHAWGLTAGRRLVPPVAEAGRRWTSLVARSRADG